jgi:hypothetical protein
MRINRVDNDTLDGYKIGSLSQIMMEEEAM